MGELAEYGMWATIGTAEQVSWFALGDHVEFRIGRLELTIAQSALTEFIAAAQAARQRYLREIEDADPDDLPDEDTAEMDAIGTCLDKVEKSERPGGSIATSRPGSLY